MRMPLRVRMLGGHCRQKVAGDESSHIVMQLLAVCCCAGHLLTHVLTLNSQHIAHSIIVSCVQVRGEMTTRRLDSLLAEDVLVRGLRLPTAMHHIAEAAPC
jgi:hypothetical protein